MNNDSRALLMYVMKHLPATQSVAETWLDKNAPYWRLHADKRRCKAKETQCKPKTESA